MPYPRQRQAIYDFLFELQKEGKHNMALQSLPALQEEFPHLHFEMLRRELIFWMDHWAELYEERRNRRP